jgi:hypothetical protein
MPRAEWMSKFDRAGISFPSNVLVVQWGRMAGKQTLAEENPNDVAGSLVGKMQGNVAMPLPNPADMASRLDPNAASGYAVRLEPGTYNLTYYELLRTQHGDFTCCAISRDGAPSFMPAVVGNAGGITHDGLTVEQYAKLSVERDNLVMQMGPQAVFSSQMAAICQKYGMPANSGGMAGRSQGWELMIQGDPAFSAQWVVHRNIASMRLQGIEPSPEQIQAMAQQQQQVTASLEQHAQQHQALNDSIEDAARHAIAFSSGQSPEAVFGEVRRVAPQAQPADVLYRALRILRDPGEDGNPRYDRVDTRVEPLARAHWLSMSEDDRRFEGGKVDKYVKEQISDIYPNNDLEVPGLMGFLGRL